MKKTLLITLLTLLLILAVGGYAVFHYFMEAKIVTKQVPSMTFESQPIAGLIATMKAMGLPARLERKGLTASAFNELETELSLVLFNRDYSIGEEDTEALLDWVSRGGHLVLAMDNHYEFPGMYHREYDGEPDTLMQALGINLVQTNSTAEQDTPLLYRYAPGKEIQVSIEPNVRFVFADERLELPDFGRQTAYRGNLHHEFQLQPDHIEQEGYAYVHLTHGKGHIGLFIDLLFLHNSRITKQRNAELSVRTMAIPQHTREVVFSYFIKPRTLFHDVLGDGWMMVISAALTLLLWVWAVVPRNGPIAEELPPQRRSLAEHIHASSRFLWNHRAEIALLEPTRLALLQRLSETHADWLNLATHERYRKLSEISRLPMGLIAEAMESEAAQIVNDGDAFLRVIQTLEQIRRSL